MSLSHPLDSMAGGQKFAFTIFDDTDAATVANTSPVYALLRDFGFRTTKSVWPLAETEPAVAVGGANCADEGYCAWALQLQAEGFETGFASHDLSGDHLWQKSDFEGHREVDPYYWAISAKSALLMYATRRSPENPPEPHLSAWR